MTTPILYPYQQRYLKDNSRFKAAMWSRQTGKTFTTALEAVVDCLEAEAQGRAAHWTILSVSKARAQDAMDNGVKLHLNAFKAVFEAMEIPMESDELAFEVRLPHGSRIRCVAANPKTARGMTENLILDEFAHHQDSRAIWTALMPVVSSPHLKLRVISTPNGKGNKFYEIMTEKEGLFSRHVVTIYDAVADGLPRNPEELKKAMGDPVSWAQEFECQFIDGATAWLTFDLIDGCEDGQAGDPARYTGGPCFVGMDIARRGDMTIISVLEEVQGIKWCRELVELRNTSFAGQLNELARIMNDYRVVRAAMDQTGMGEMPVEMAKASHGSNRVEGVLFTGPAKLYMATALKDCMEDHSLRLPKSQDLRADLHSVRRVAGPTGAPRLVAGRDEADGSHADRFWSLALAVSASKTDIPDFSQCEGAGKTDTARLSSYAITNLGWGTVRRLDRGY